MHPELAELARLAGLWPDYLDQTGVTRVTGEETARTLLAALRVPAGTSAEVRESLDAWRAAEARRRLPRWKVVEPGSAFRLDACDGIGWSLTLEDGSHREGAGADLPGVPLGLHDLEAAGERMTILSAPRTLPLPRRAWGVTLPLYGLKPGGLGDFGDLARALEALAGHGAAFAGINPIHAGFFPNPVEISPYAPSQRRRLNPAYLAGGTPVGRSGDLVDYPAAFAARWAALEAEFAAGVDRGDAFEAWRRSEGEDLDLFATHQALSEVHGPFWTTWPEALRDPTSQATKAFAAANPERRTLHSWLQYRTERALEEVSTERRDMRFGLYLDIAVGTHPAGAETWAERDLFAIGVSLGAPPDAFSRDGQTWGLAPLDPHRLAEAGFRPLAEMLRKQFSFSRLVRIDHILGLDRTFWVPEADGLPGAYVSMPREALLAVVRIEAARAGATVIGEDLGNVPQGLRSALSEAGILGCRVAMFEFGPDGRATPPEAYTEAALASFGTHDLPTWAGWRRGRDIEHRHALGSIDEAGAAEAQETRRAEVRAFDEMAGEGPDQPTAHLARCNARLVALQIEDILGVIEQPNLPGTVESHPNWRRPVPVPPGDWAAEPGLSRAGEIMRAAGRKEE